MRTRLWITVGQLDAAAAGAGLVLLELLLDFSDEVDELEDSDLVDELSDLLAELSDLLEPLFAESRLSLR